MGGAASVDDHVEGELTEEMAAAAIRMADALLITTGAGMGVDSGLGTFRGVAAGVWPPLKAMQLDFSKMSRPHWFEMDPRLAWAFWKYRYEAYTKSTPHQGYKIASQWGSSKKLGFFSVTSNIDGHWERTQGVAEARVYEVHGTVKYMHRLEAEDAELGTEELRTELAHLLAEALREDGPLRLVDFDSVNIRWFLMELLQRDRVQGTQRAKDCLEGLAGAAIEEPTETRWPNFISTWMQKFGSELGRELHQREMAQRLHPTDGEMMAAVKVPDWNLKPGEAVEVQLIKQDANGGVYWTEYVSKPTDQWVPAVVGEDGCSVFDQDGVALEAKALRKNAGGPDLFRVLEDCPLPQTPSGNPARPAVLMFMDGGVLMDRINAQEIQWSEWMLSLPKDARLVILEVGAGIAIQTIRIIGQNAAKDFQNSTLIRINFEHSGVPPELANRSCSIERGALDALGALDTAVRAGESSGRSRQSSPAPAASTAKAKAKLGAGGKAKAKSRGSSRS